MAGCINIRLGDLDEVEKEINRLFRCLMTTKDNHIEFIGWMVCNFICDNTLANQPTIAPETVPIVQELRSINKRLKAVVKVQLEQLREKTSVIDELCEKVADLDEKLYWVTKERDAAIAERDELIRGMKIFGSGCYSCKHFDRSNGKFRAEEPCGVNNNWEWRGIQEAQKDE